MLLHVAGPNASSKPRVTEYGMSRLAEGVEELLQLPFSAEIGEHCQISESLSY